MSPEEVFWIDDPAEKLRQRRETSREMRRLEPRRRKRRWPWILLFFVVVGGSLYLLRRPLLRAAGSFLDVSEPLRPAHYVMVLAGDPDVTPFYAAALYRAGLAAGILVTQPRRPPDVLDGIVPPEEELTQQILLHSGVLAIDVVEFPGEMHGTDDEARALGALLTDKTTAEVTVVTVAHRTRRVRRILRQQLGDKVGRVRVLGVPVDDYGPGDWWHSQPGYLAYLSELVKLPYQTLVD